MRITAVILAGGKGTRLASLSVKRAKPAVPFAGKYRIIDFALSNCVNSGIFDLLVLTQYRPHSLNDHIGKGRPWDLDRTFTGGVQLLQPFQGSFDTDWYAGTADAVTQNLNFIRRSRPDYVLILSGDHIYQMDYDLLIQHHRAKGADATVCTIRVPMDEASRFGILDVDDDLRVKAFLEKPENPPSNLASMGIYVFNYDVLEKALKEDQADIESGHDFGHNIVPKLLDENYDVFTYPYAGYWIDVGTLDAYWEAHMDLLNSPPSLNLSDRTWIIHTRSEERPPVRIGQNTTIQDSLISDGVVIGDGAHVERSVISPGTVIDAGAVVRDSIIFNDAYVEKDAVVERAIIDKIAIIGEGAHVGNIDDVGLGIVCIGKNTHVPDGYQVGAGCILGTDLQTQQFFDTYPDKRVPGGAHFGFSMKK